MPRPEELIFPSRKERFEDRRKETSTRKLLDEFFDHQTLLAVSRLVTQGQFDAIDYPVSTGKEGGVFRASGASGYRAVKIYRVSNSVFRHLPPYAIEELRRSTSTGNFGRMIYAWTRREHTILRRLQAAAVRCPVPYGYFRNVLVMDFIGTDGFAAPRLRDAVIEDAERLYRDLVEEIGRMIRDAHLVHGDLSPYNVLYQDGRPVLIDVAQAIESDHPQALGLLERDISHFSRFLQKLGADVTPRGFLDAVGGSSVGPKE